MADYTDHGDSYVGGWCSPPECFNGNMSTNITKLEFETLIDSEEFCFMGSLANIEDTFASGSGGAGAVKPGCAEAIAFVKSAISVRTEIKYTAEKNGQDIVGLRLSVPTGFSCTAYNSSTYNHNSDGTPLECNGLMNTEYPVPVHNPQGELVDWGVVGYRIQTISYWEKSFIEEPPHINWDKDTYKYIPDEGWEYNDYSEPCFIKIDKEIDPCVQKVHISIDLTGPTEFCPGDVLTYKIKETIKQECKFDYPIGGKWIYLSYLSGTLIRGVEFDAPTKVFMDYGETEVSFDIKIYMKDTRNKKLVVQITAS